MDSLHLPKWPYKPRETVYREATMLTKPFLVFVSKWTDIDLRLHRHTHTNRNIVLHKDFHLKPFRLFCFVGQIQKKTDLWFSSFKLI